jgi:uncharacterized membrane protein YkvA (DUF1232 family)
MLKWETIKRYSQRAGREVLAVSEATYLTFLDPDLSWKAKSALLGSLAYLLLPVDALPDFLPGGYADDLSVMLTALLSTGKLGQKHLKKCRIKYGLIPAEKGKEQD